MRAGHRSVVVLTALLLAGCVLPGAGISPYGKATTIYPRTGEMLSGELLAASPDSVWLMSGGTRRGFGVSDIRRINVERHQFGAKKTLVWMGIAGAGTGVALLLACGSYNASSDEGSASCGGVLPGTLLSYLTVGGLLALANEYSSKYHLTAADTEQLRAFARYPRGLPDSAPVLAAPRAP